MSTSPNPFKYLWSAEFDDGHIIRQPADDRYSKHIDGAEWNPSAFRDVVEYGETHNLTAFVLANSDLSDIFMIDLLNGDFRVNGIDFSLEDEPLKDRKIVFWREMYQNQTLGEELQAPFVNRYILGYEGFNSENKKEQKVIYING